MSIPLDASRPYRWQAELVELIENILATDPNNESVWIEWKSQLDLGAKAGQEHIAKQVLGFANRTVQRAMQYTSGYAYLVAGAEPSSLNGITTVDQAKLHPAIIKWVGPDARFHLEYVPVRTKMVLVAVVEPPEPGDPIYPLRSQLGNHEAGCILVRRPGATHPATAREIDELVARVRAGGSRISLSVQAAPIERIPRHADFSELTEQERQETLARPRVEAKPSTPSQFAFQAVMTNFNNFSEPDPRTDEQYEQEVARYANTYREALEHSFAWMIWRHDPCWLHIETHNTTDLNFTDVALEFHIAGQVRRWPDDWMDAADDDDEPTFPERPVPLGTRKSRLDVGLSALSSISIPRFPPASQTNGPRYTVTDTGSVTIALDHFDVRAKQRKQLLPVPVLVEAPAGTLLTCDWTATALNAQGQEIGRFMLTVEESTFNPDALTQATS